VTLTTVARVTAAATIADTQSLSGAVDLGNSVLIGVMAPAANWTAAKLTYQGSVDGVTYVTVMDPDTGTEYETPSVAAAQGYPVDPKVFLPWRFVKVRSGTTAVPVAQAGGDALTLVARSIQ
jgi:hypothetical protein